MPKSYFSAFRGGYDVHKENGKSYCVLMETCFLGHGLPPATRYFKHFTLQREETRMPLHSHAVVI